MQKTCTRCQNKFPLVAFSPHPNSEFGVRPECKLCRAEYERSRKLRPGVKEGLKNSALKHMYGITAEEWESCFEFQNRSCAICKSTKPNGKYWATDHNHKTGVFRGILCVRCNTGIGLLMESQENLRAAVKYLQSRG